MMYKSMLRLFSHVSSSAFSSNLPLHAFITGANRGIGLALTEKLMSEGIRVSAAVRDPEHSGELQDLRIKNADLLCIHQLDVRNEAGIKNLSLEITDPIDFLIHNAGILGPIGKEEEISLESFEEVFRTNTFAPWILSQHFLNHVRKSQLQTIVNITTNFGVGKPEEVEGFIPYRASKENSAFLMRILNSMDPHVRVINLHPGWVRTNMGGPHGELTPSESAEKIYRVLKDTSSKPKDKLEKGIIDVTTYRERVSSPLPGITLGWI